MGNGLTGIDHVIVAVNDLEEARTGWARLGFTVTPRGRHIGQGTANYCIMFPGDYLELLGFAEPDEYAHRLQDFLAHREGPMSIAFAPDGSVEDAVADLRKLGLHPGEPRALGRELELPEGTVVPRFILSTLPPEETPDLDCFICGHLTPELVRRPQWLAHPNGVTGLRSVTVLVADTTPLLPAYDRLFGLHEVTTTDAVAAVRAGRHRLLFMTQDDFETMNPGVYLDADFTVPAIVALEMAVTNLERTAECLTQSQVPFEEISDFRIYVGAEAANGAILFFTQA